MAESPLAPSWLAYPPDVNALTPELWAHGVSRNDNGALSIQGIDFTALAQEFGTPLFVLDEQDFRSRAAAFRTAFEQAFAAHGGAKVFYAAKAFLSTAIARWVIHEGLYLDTCSGGEMLVARTAGVPSERVGLHGNNKSDAELEYALDWGVGRIIVDAHQELERLNELALARNTQANIMLRLTPGVHAHTHEYIATAHEDQKFGFSIAGGLNSPAAAAVAFALSAKGLRLDGVHSHIGSQIFDAQGFDVAAQKMIAFAALIKQEHDVELAELDLGGGYGIAYTSQDDPQNIARIAQDIAAVVESACAEHGLAVPELSFEPGRAIAGPACCTLYTAGVSKDISVDLPDQAGTQNRRYLSVDGGMSDNPRPVLYDADYSAVLASRASSREPVLTRVVGKHCESGDIVVKDAYLPEDVQRGDLVAVPGTGAYCWVLSSNYNFARRPAVIAVRDGKARVIVRGESEQDLLSRDVGDGQEKG